jgi:hypothetical protein
MRSHKDHRDYVTEYENPCIRVLYIYSAALFAVTAVAAATIPPGRTKVG